MDRVPFSPDLQPLRNSFLELIPILEAESDWYGSVFFERKTIRNYAADLKQTRVSDQFTQGAVLRIYNGFTLFEQATDELDPGALKLIARNLAERVAATAPPSGTQRRSYHPPTWAERLENASSKYDREITTQIPPQLSATTPVHFGVRIAEDPKALSTEQWIQRAQDTVRRCQRVAIQKGLKKEDLTFVTARIYFSEEESIFVDRETNLSQNLYRIALTVITMSGSDRTNLRLGGLGGLEAIPFTDVAASHLLEDLKSLKTAERMKPGKYRVLFSPVVSGVIAHEAFGHAQEADTCARGRSKAWELHQTGEKVGNEQATIMNNPAIYRNGIDSYAAWGSYFFDEEGWLAQEQTLLDRGKLMSPMTNLTSAIRLGIPRSANGKRESWANGVYTRQTNTYFTPGEQTLEQLMAQIDEGFLATQPAGGMEDPKGMGIQVGVQFLKEIKNGKLTGKVFKGPAGGDVQLTGFVPEVLFSIIGKSKIEAESSEPDSVRYPANDAGGCGKYHKEFVFAGCGGPYMLLDQVTLG